MNVLVIGESCEDVFWYGKSDRISPEGNYPVFIPEFYTTNVGMAGNVEANLISLGCETSLISQKESISKVRYISKKFNQGIIRIDTEKDVKRVDEDVLRNIKYELYDAVIISDYNKGFLSEDDINFIGKSHPLTILDTKKKLDNWIDNISFVKINNLEYTMNKSYVDSYKNIEKFIITADENGVFWKNNQYKVPKVEILDVTGAGDTFVSAFSFKYFHSKDVEQAIHFANKCSIQVVQHRGVTVINKSKINL